MFFIDYNRRFLSTGMELKDKHTLGYSSLVARKNKKLLDEISAEKLTLRSTDRRRSTESRRGFVKCMIKTIWWSREKMLSLKFNSVKLLFRQIQFRIKFFFFLILCLNLSIVNI